MEIQISSIQPSTSENDLVELFAGFTIVRCSKVRTVSDVGKDVMNTFAYVSIEDHFAGEAAIAKLHNSSFQDKIVHVEKAN